MLPKFHIFAAMKDYVRTDIQLTPWNEDLADYLAALLGDVGYESFTQAAPVLTAYINKECFTEQNLENVLADFMAPDVSLQVSNSIVEGEDWNHEWEKHYFQPIIVGGKCVVRSSFHTDAPKAEYEILVDPRMAFGTGHHSTTRLMLEYLLEHNLADKTIIDMGTGTGILAILSCMLGAKDVYGIEIDPDAYANACDNALLNHVKPHLLCGDADTLQELPEADLMLANINRNIIVADLAAYRKNLHSGSRFVCSGFYRSDLDIIAAHASTLGMHLENFAEDQGWIRAEFSVS